MGKNLSNVNTLSFTGSQSVTFENVIPSGVYTISAVVESADTDAEYCLILFTYSDDTTKEVSINRSADGERVSTTTTFEKDVKKARFYAGSSYTTSTGDTASFDMIQIEAGEQMTDYEAYQPETDPEPEPEPEPPEPPESEYEPPASEIGKYYKALAGYTVDLPEPTCRETQLIKKLIDSEYVPDFTSAGCNTEAYLFDLINGTQEMAEHEPGNDAEKYLAALTGNTVEDMPELDCERNFWMNEAVKAMTEDADNVAD